MRLPNRTTFSRKSRLQRALGTVQDSVGVPSGLKGLRGLGSNRAVRAGLIATGGLAGLTAGSAGVSSLRRRGEGRKDT